ncbi:hypothetical protein K227x_06340 [Rubripirellula lacrimiformis]|uniref:Ice-binding protein C-terminal domain-containing protein n=1 Tax=Rubripirellula lacrimiformis TaxID=1930273 RepID=A0A517N571_9BACT|nr:PEP-CTERM sorting domain-containing protein [Rubripirellula lacrimiformis]QDT02261.1 hypothetical protein K227x_06340 [Rubripirellula lacrimiformis]
MKMRFLLAALAIAVSACSTSQAAIVTTELTFDTPDSVNNTLDLSLFGSTAETQITGKIIALLEINTSTGVISSFKLDGGSLTTSAWTMNIPVANMSLDTSVANGTGGSDTGDPINTFSEVTGSTFDATHHFIHLTSGTVEVTTVAPASTDTLELDNTDIPGIGNGTITSTLNGGVYDIVFSMDIDDMQELSPGASLLISGGLLARGQVTAVPEPTSAVALAGIVGACVLYRRRKRSSNAI